jgi:Fic family protein|tara:strand:- start:1922 stop:3130 length:1209 start_codon:yes stop_codon:yes gene_type:complete
MSDSILDIAPFTPSDKALQGSALPDKAMELHKKSAKLSGQLAEQTRLTLETYMRVINSYYSNLIEGNATRPHEIRAAQRGSYSQDLARRDLQKESLGHMAVQEWLQEQPLDLEQVFSPEFIKQIHKQFYDNIPESLWDIKNDVGELVGRVVPGEWRDQLVEVGVHVPPNADSLPSLMNGFCDTYHPKRFSGDRKLIAIMAAHHRFTWIHPFLDGNGRVGRLITDAALKAAGLDSYGVWCLSRGLANKNSNYKKFLALADQPRQGDYDGRGQLSEKGLVTFCDYMLDAAIDQVDYISDLLDLNRLKKRIDAYIQARNDSRVQGMDKELKPVAGLILHAAFMYGEIDRGQALELSGMPERSARRLLAQLKSDGLLSETSSKSPLRWEIPEHAEPWYFPGLAPQI